MDTKKELMPLYEELYALQATPDTALQASVWRSGKSEQSRLTSEVQETRTLIQVFVLLWVKLRAMESQAGTTWTSTFVKEELEHLAKEVAKVADSSEDDVTRELSMCLCSLSTFIMKGADAHSKSSELIHEPCERHDIAQLLYATLQEGVGKDGQTVTPADVAEVVIEQCSDEKTNGFLIDPTNGLGFYANLLQRGKVGLVELLKGQKQRRIVFAKEPFSKSQYFADAIATLLNIGIDSAQTRDNSAIKTVLLFNACNQSNLLSIDSDNLKLSSRFSEFLRRKPSLVACITPNSVLAGGRGLLNVNAVLELFIANGLYKVIQLPAGTIAAMHQAFSLLLFRPEVPSKEIEFAQLLPSSELGERQPVIDAKRGYGRPLRRKVFSGAVLRPKGLNFYLKVKVVGTQDLLLETADPKQRLLSLEAPYIVNRSTSENIPGVTEFCMLSDIADVERVQHFEAAEGELSSIQFLEIGSDDIGEFGQLVGGVRRQASERSSARLEQNKLVSGNLFLCIRGAIGKTGYMSANPERLTAPNQSFVKITLKETETARRLGTDFLYWWIRSKYFQDSLAKKVIAAGVPRLSIHDVRKQSVPIAPYEYIETHRKDYGQWQSMAQDISQLRQDMRNIEDTAWLPVK